MSKFPSPPPPGILNPPRFAVPSFTPGAVTWPPIGAAPPAVEFDPAGTDAHAPGAKLDGGKALPWLCISGFAHALAEVAEVTTRGARKYTPNGWMAVPDGETRYMDAALRHLLALGRGEGVDPDTGCLHKAQVVWNLLASLELEIRGREAPPVPAPPEFTPHPWRPGVDKEA